MGQRIDGDRSGDTRGCAALRLGFRRAVGRDGWLYAVVGMGLSLLVMICSGRMARAQGDEGGEAGAGHYMRVVDLDDTHMRLDVAVRLFAPGEGEGPTVALAGAIHIAEADYYRLLQRFLDGQDLVLFEGVKPRGTEGVGREEDLDDTARARRTEVSIRFIAIMVERYKRERGELPATLEELSANPPGRGEAKGATDGEGGQDGGGVSAALMRQWIDSSRVDSWGRALVYKVDGGKFDVRSLGADGAAGGEGANADLAFANQKKLSKLELGEEPGIQSRMARALGLAFQLDAMSTDGPIYRNSDMTIDQIQERIAEKGGDADVLLKVLEGSSFVGGLLKFSLAIIERSPTLAAMTRVMLVEAMRMAEEGLGETAGLPASFAAIMEVILKERNQVVIDDLKAVIAERDPARRTIAIVYGAGHMRDMEQRLVEQCGYRPAGGFWLSAMTVDLAEAGITKQDLEQTRAMMKFMTR